MVVKMQPMGWGLTRASRLVIIHARYSHCDRANAHAHLRATLLGRPIALAMADGDVLLGQYQSVILAEIDGPRDRRLQVQIVGE